MIGINSHIGIYKGKCVYNYIILRKEYPISKFGEPQKEWMPFYNGHSNKATVYVFYDVNGKKLFHVDTSRENAEKFYDEMKRHYYQIQREAREREKKKGAK